MVVFSAALFFVLDYVFACEIQNWIGILTLTTITLGIITLYWSFGRYQIAETKAGRIRQCM